MLKYARMILLAGALGAVMSGCVSSDDPDFQVGVERAYVIQKNTEFGGKQFAFYGTVAAFYGTATDVQLRKDYMPLFLNKLATNFYEVDARYLDWGPLASWNGTYELSAMDEKGVEARNTFRIDIVKEMGDLTLTEPLKYENGILTAKWKKVDGATAYGFLLGVGKKDGDTYTFSRINTVYGGECTTDQDVVSGSLRPRNLELINTNGISDGTELVVAAVAAIVSQSGYLYLEGDYYKIVLGEDGITPITTPVLGVY